MNAPMVAATRGTGLDFLRQDRPPGEHVTATARNDAGLARLQTLGASAFDALHAANPDSAARWAARSRASPSNAWRTAPVSTGSEPTDSSRRQRQTSTT